MFMRASGASEVDKFDILHTKSAIFLPIFCRYFRYIVGTKWYAYGMALYKRKYTDKALTLCKSMFMRASRTRELENFGIFTY